MTAGVIVWAFLTLLALAGWATTLVFLGKSLLPQAKALQTLFAIDKHIDDRIGALIDRAKQMEQRNTIAATQDAERRTMRQREQTRGGAQDLRELFGSEPFGLAEQPDGLEVMGL